MSALLFTALVASAFPRFESDQPLDKDQSSVAFTLGGGSGIERVLITQELSARWVISEVFAAELRIPWGHYDVVPDTEFNFQPEPAFFGGDSLRMGNVVLGARARTAMGENKRGRLESGVDFAFGTAGGDIPAVAQTLSMGRLHALERVYVYLPRYAAVVVPLDIETVSSWGVLVQTEFDFVALLPTNAANPGGAASVVGRFGYRGGWFDITLGAGAAFAIVLDSELNRLGTSSFSTSAFLEPALKLYSSGAPFAGEHIALDLRGRVIPALNNNFERIDAALFMGLSVLWD